MIQELWSTHCVGVYRVCAGSTIASIACHNTGPMCHLPLQEAVFTSQLAKVFRFRIAKSQRFSVFKLLPSEIVKR